MIGRGFVDLDELVIYCRSEQARQYVAEAVASYKGGAYRAVIVTTWIAVVFDVLHKLRELDLAGDKNARRRVQEFETIRAGGDWKQAVDFERKVLDLAKDEFELLATMEHLEPSRLRDDRNRCAHPSMLSAEEPYQPSAELARYHLRNAVTYLLGQPPVQGKAALGRILQEVESPYFPMEWSGAREWFSSGPLARARDPLVRSLIIVLTKTLLLSSEADAERVRKVSALTAIFEMYREVSEATLREKFIGIAGQVDDDDWSRMISYVRSVPIAWDMLGAGLQLKSRRFVEEVSADHAAPVVADALHIPALATVAASRIGDLPVTNLAELLLSEPLPQYADAAIRHFANAQSYLEARTLGRTLLLPVAPNLTAEQLQVVLCAFVDNTQISESIGMPGIYTTLLQQTGEHSDVTCPEWTAVRDKLGQDPLDESKGRLRNLIEKEVLSSPIPPPES